MNIVFDTSIKVAFELGYRVIVPKDATTTFDNDIISGKVLKLIFRRKVFGRIDLLKL